MSDDAIYAIAFIAVDKKSIVASYNERFITKDRVGEIWKERFAGVSGTETRFASTGSHGEERFWYSQTGIHKETGEIRTFTCIEMQ